MAEGPQCEYLRDLIRHNARIFSFTVPRFRKTMMTLIPMIVICCCFITLLVFWYLTENFVKKMEEQILRQVQSSVLICIFGWFAWKWNRAWSITQHELEGSYSIVQVSLSLYLEQKLQLRTLKEMKMEKFFLSGIVAVV